MVANRKTKYFQVCDSRTVENFSGLWQISFNMILPQTGNTNFIHKWHTMKILYICETTFIYTTFAFDSLFRELAVFTKMKDWDNKSVLE